MPPVSPGVSAVGRPPSRRSTTPGNFLAVPGQRPLGQVARTAGGNPSLGQHHRTGRTLALLPAPHVPGLHPVVPGPVPSSGPYMTNGTAPVDGRQTEPRARRTLPPTNIPTVSTPRLAHIQTQVKPPCAKRTPEQPNKRSHPRQQGARAPARSPHYGGRWAHGR